MPTEKKPDLMKRRAFVKTAALAAALASDPSVSYIQARAADPGRFASLFLPRWKRAKASVLEFADIMPEDHYGFRPTPEIRSFAEQILHIAASHYAVIANVVAQSTPPVDPEALQQVEDKTKAEIIESLDASFGYVAEVVGEMTDAQAEVRVPFGETMELTKEEVVLFLEKHTTHHRGQMVIYLRLQGITPPRSILF